MKYYSLIVISFIVWSCKSDKRYHDKVPKEVLPIQSEALQDILNFHNTLNKEFKNPLTSPLPNRYRKNFERLDFFTPDTNYIVKAEFVRTPETLPFNMPTTTGRRSIEKVYGIAHFKIQGKAQRLEIYQNQESSFFEKKSDYLFLPFTDATNGKETYAGGRYIDLTIPNSDTITIDFNKAYNPYCAYNKKYSCPIVPKVNALSVKILAGVKAFKKN